MVFIRSGHDPSVERGEVLVSLFGDVEAVAEDERDRWGDLVANGLAIDWWTDDTEVHIDEFDEPELLHHRMRVQRVG